MLLDLVKIEPGMYQVMKRPQPPPERIITGWTKFRDWFFGPPTPPPAQPKWVPVFGGHGWIQVSVREGRKDFHFCSHKDYNQRHMLPRKTYSFEINDAGEAIIYFESFISMHIGWSWYKHHYTHDETRWQNFAEAADFTHKGLMHVIERQNEQNQTRQ